MFLHTDLSMGAYSAYKQTYQHYPSVIATIWRALSHSQSDSSVVSYLPDFGHNPMTKGSLSILMKKKSQKTLKYHVMGRKYPSWSSLNIECLRT